MIRRRRGAALLAASAAIVGVSLALATGGSTGRTNAHARGRPDRAGAGRSVARRPTSAGRRSSVDYASSAAVRRLITDGRPVFCGGRRGREIALTFDDGPGPYTRLVLAKLRKHDIRATFFVVARNIPLVPGAVRAERAIGAVGDHTFTHPLLTSLAPGAAKAQVVAAQHAIEHASGGPVVLFRPPYGARDRTVDHLVRAHGMVEVLWSVDSADSLGANYRQIERNVIGGLRPGAIVLMHENHGQTVRALLAIFAAIARRHLRTVSVPRLLADDPPETSPAAAPDAGCHPAGRSAGPGD